MAEQTAPIIRRTDVDLRKAVSKAQCSVGKALSLDVFTSLPQIMSCFSTKYCQVLISKVSGISSKLNKSNRKAMNRNWSNQRANPALKTKAGK